MALSDGDLYVSGSILSYQQMKRIYQNFRAATVPSNLQPGALFSDSDDDKLHHQGVTELLEVFTEKTTLTWENLLSNSGFGVWSQSDASKGLATITYDVGSKGAGAAPSVGDAVVGGTSGATCKLISYTITEGAWADNNAKGILTVGAVSHDFAFVDNETLTFDGVETCLVNMPDSAVQVGLVQNGGFATDTDPPPGWTAHAGATLTTEAAGQVGNCMMISVTNAWEYGYQAITTVVGKIYKLSVYFKKGTASAGAIYIGTSISGTQYYDSGSITNAAWTVYMVTFEATSTTAYITLCSGEGGAKTAYFDEVIDYEITPCCTGADTKAADYHSKTSTLDAYQVKDDSTHIEASYYGLQLVKTVATAEYYNLNKITNRAFLDKKKGQTYTIGCYVYDDSGGDDNIKLQIYDGVATVETAFFTSGAKQWLEVTITVDDSATEFTPRILCDGDIGDIAYISPIMLVKGSSIGEGNYAPKQDEWVYGEKFIPSNKYDNTTSLSDAVYAILNIEADSDAKIPKGIKAVLIHIEATDTGSGAVTDLHVHCRKDSTASRFFTLCFAGKLNNAEGHAGGMQPCNSDGDIEVELEASGVGTLSISRFRFLGVQVN